MFDPPNEEGRFRDAYLLGWEAAKRGWRLDKNPYTPSGHERDTTFEDELHYQWYRGHEDFEIAHPVYKEPNGKV